MSEFTTEVYNKLSNQIDMYFFDLMVSEFSHNIIKAPSPVSAGLVRVDNQSFIQQKMQGKRRVY